MRKNWTAFKSLHKQNQIFRIVNLVVMGALCLTCVALAFYYGFVYDPNNRIVPAICIALLALVPLVIEMIFGRRFNNVVFLSIEIYLIFAGLIGSVLNVYYLVSWYDIVIHILMGYLVAMCGIFVISRLGNYKKMNVVLVAFFCLCFSLAIEVLWEIFEWGADNLFNQTMQGEKLPGVNQPLVGDTMLDLVCNTTGAAIFFFHFLIGKFSKKSLGINFIEKQLTKEEALMIADQQEQPKKELNEPKTEQIDASTPTEKVEETPQEFEENKVIEAKSTVKKSQKVKRASSGVAKPKQTKSKTKTTEK